MLSCWSLSGGLKKERTLFLFWKTCSKVRTFLESECFRCRALLSLGRQESSERSEPSAHCRPSLRARKKRSPFAHLLGKSQLASSAPRNPARNATRRRAPGACVRDLRLQFLVELPTISGRYCTSAGAGGRGCTRH